MAKEKKENYKYKELEDDSFRDFDERVRKFKERTSRCKLDNTKTKRKE